MTLNDAVAAEVRAEMARQRLSIRDLSKLCGIPQTTLARKMRTDARLDLDDLQVIADALRVEVFSLIPRRLPATGTAESGAETQRDGSGGFVNIRWNSSGSAGVGGAVADQRTGRMASVTPLTRVTREDGSRESA